MREHSLIQDHPPPEHKQEREKTEFHHQKQNERMKNKKTSSNSKEFDLTKIQNSAMKTR
jgi:hypothetical protein